MMKINTYQFRQIQQGQYRQCRLSFYIYSNSQYTPLMQSQVESQPRHILSHVLPNTLCKLLNNAVIVINLGWSRNSPFLTIGMGVATIFSFVFGYLLICSLNIGLTYQISRKRNDPLLIGVFYQRALLVNFLTCAFVITPLLYISKNLVDVFQSIDSNHLGVASQVGRYLYQLVPSIYAFAFYDTTQSFLQAQGHILAPLVIQVVAVLIHLMLVNYIGPAWSKNAIDFLSCLAIYGYISLLPRPLASWSQWTLKCIKGWRNHMKFLEIIGLTTYLQAFFLFAFCFLAYRLESAELVCHIFYINIYMILYLIFIGIKEGALSKIGFHLKQNQYELYRKEGVNSLKLFVGSSLLVVLFVFIYQQEICEFFLQNAEQTRVFRDNFFLLGITILLDSFEIGISSLLKALNKNYSVLKLNVLIYLLSLCSGYYFCYVRGWGLTGLWGGWLLGLSVNIVCSSFMLRSKEIELRLSQVFPSAPAATAKSSVIEG